MLNSNPVLVANTVRKVSKRRVFSGLYFPLFSPNKEKYGPGKKSVFGHFSRSANTLNAVQKLFLKKIILVGKTKYYVIWIE